MTTQIQSPRSKIMDFINSYRSEHGFSPTVREISNSVHLSLSTVQYHLDTLKGQGYISRKDHSSRSVQVIDTSGITQTNLAKLFSACAAAQRLPEQLDVLSDMLVDFQQGRALTKDEWTILLKSALDTPNNEI